MREEGSELDKAFIRKESVGKQDQYNTRMDIWQIREPEKYN